VACRPPRSLPGNPDGVETGGGLPGVRVAARKMVRKSCSQQWRRPFVHPAHIPGTAADRRTGNRYPMRMVPGQPDSWCTATENGKSLFFLAVVSSRHPGIWKGRRKQPGFGELSSLHTFTPEWCDLCPVHSDRTGVSCPTSLDRTGIKWKDDMTDLCASALTG